jgi:hypothetical protein
MPRNQVEKGRLPGAVRSDDGRQLSLADAQADVIGHVDSAKMPVQIINF